MSTYVMLSKLGPESLKDSGSFETLERQAVDRIREDCPDVEWVQNLAMLGPYDYLDVFRAPDTDTAMKVAMLVRTHGRAQTEVWPATEWERFKAVGRELK